MTSVYVIEITYRTVGVKLIGLSCYGARFVVLKHLTFFEFLSDLVECRLNVGSGTKISPRHVILHFSFRHKISELLVIH